jgi:hypothetical protein
LKLKKREFYGDRALPYFKIDKEYNFNPTKKINPLAPCPNINTYSNDIGAQFIETGINNPYTSMNSA